MSKLPYLAIIKKDLDAAFYRFLLDLLNFLVREFRNAFCRFWGGHTH